jgi:uncharacterized phage protein (TIGR01671 family)
VVRRCFRKVFMRLKLERLINLKNMTLKLDRFKLRWYDPQLQYMTTVISSNIEDDFAFVKYSYSNEQVKLSDGILMQSTGLRDKNGKLIYEGDIIKHETVRLHKNKPPFLKYETLEVLWKDGRWLISNHKKILHLTSSDYGCEFPYIEIIGNIDENHELLENV